jgi:hypothetical protein
MHSMFTVSHLRTQRPLEAYTHWWWNGPPDITKLCIRSQAQISRFQGSVSQTWNKTWTYLRDTIPRPQMIVSSDTIPRPQMRAGRLCFSKACTNTVPLMLISTDCICKRFVQLPRQKRGKCVCGVPHSTTANRVLATKLWQDVAGFSSRASDYCLLVWTKFAEFQRNMQGQNLVKYSYCNIIKKERPP